MKKEYMLAFVAGLYAGMVKGLAGDPDEKEDGREYPDIDTGETIIRVIGQ